MSDKIDFNSIRHLLLAAIEGKGYKIDREKTSRNDKVFRHPISNDKIIVSSKSNFELYYNPNNAQDKGSVTMFLLHRIHDNGNPNTSNSLKDSACISAVKDEIRKLTTSYQVQEEWQKPIEKKELSLKGIKPLKENPQALERLLNHRNIDPNIDSDIKDAIYLLKTEKKDKTYYNPTLIFRTNNGDICGAMSYYVAYDSSVKKMFLEGSERSRGIWSSTNLSEKKKLLVCEDFLDALAHRQLHGNEYGYVTTGGSITSEQIRVIKGLAHQSNNKLQLVLGNDNDIAGQIANLKIICEDRIAVRTLTKEHATFSLNGVEHKEIALEPLRKIVEKEAQESGFIVECPTKKDWNDMLKKKVVRSDMLDEAVKTTTQSTAEIKIHKTQKKL